MSARLIHRTIPALLAGLFLMACGTPAEKVRVESVRRGGLGLAQFDDIPVPRLYRYDTEKSYRYPDGRVAAGAFRLGEFHYWRTGRHDDETREFYATEMTRDAYGWSDGGTKDGVQTYFKGPDTVTVRCRYDANGTTRVVIGLNHDPDERP